MKKQIDSSDMNVLMDAVLTLKDRDEVSRFFDDLCTIGELEAMQQRLVVAQMLTDEKTYQDIAEVTGASTATISRVNRTLRYGNKGYEIALKRLKAE